MSEVQRIVAAVQHLLALSPSEVASQIAGGEIEFDDEMIAIEEIRAFMQDISDEDEFDAVQAALDDDGLKLLVSVVISAMEALAAERQRAGKRPR